MRGSVACFALASLLPACAGPRPAIPTAAAIVAPPGWIGPSRPGSPISERWWEGFGDETLTRIVDRALANNVDLAIAASRVREARAQTRLAHAQLLPTLGFAGAALTDRDLSPFGVAEYQSAAEPQLTVSYDADLFGRLSKESAAAVALLLATQDARDVLRLAVAATACSGYIALRSLDARLLIARRTLADRASALRFARRRAEVGYTSQLEMRQAEAEYHATERLVPQAELAIARQENALRVLTGDVPGPIERGSPLSELTIPPIPDGLPADVLRRRPDIGEAEMRLVAADHSLDASRAAFLPSLNLTGGTGLLLSTLLPNPVTIWSIGGSILAPIFTGGRLRARADIATARRDEAAFNYRKTALIAFEEVENGLAGLSQTERQLRALDAQRASLVVTVRLASNRYNAGYAPYIDQLDAQRGLLGAELAVVQADNDRFAAAVSLFQAMGGGWNLHHPDGKGD